MCRLTFYQGPPIRISSLITEPKHSLIHQSFDAKERPEPLNGDGFGLAWYDLNNSPEPAIFRSVTPAWNNRNLQELSRVIASECILAHVRAATQGLVVSESNCHPFKIGSFAFMHNGDIGDFPNIRRRMLAEMSDRAFQSIQGTTDSEHFFALFMDNLWKNGDGSLVNTMTDTIQQVVSLVEKYNPDQYCYFNLLLTNGESSLAVRFTTDNPENANSLYINSGKRYSCEDGVCFMANEGSDEKAVIISSEPLSQDPGWESVPVNQIIQIKDGTVNQSDAIKL